MERVLLSKEVLLSRAYSPKIETQRIESYFFGRTVEVPFYPFPGLILTGVNLYERVSSVSYDVQSGEITCAVAPFDLLSDVKGPAPSSWESRDEMQSHLAPYLLRVCCQGWAIVKRGG